MRRHSRHLSARACSAGSRVLQRPGFFSSREKGPGRGIEPRQPRPGKRARHGVGTERLGGRTAAREGEGARGYLPAGKSCYADYAQWLTPVALRGGRVCGHGPVVALFSEWLSVILLSLDAFAAAGFQGPAAALISGARIARGPMTVMLQVRCKWAPDGSPTIFFLPSNFVNPPAGPSPDARANWRSSLFNWSFRQEVCK